MTGRESRYDRLHRQLTAERLRSSALADAAQHADAKWEEHAAALREAADAAAAAAEVERATPTVGDELAGVLLAVVAAGEGLAAQRPCEDYLDAETTVAALYRELHQLLDG